MTVSVTVVVAEPASLVAVTVKTVAVVRFSVGIPEITPLTRLSPSGKSGVIVHVRSAASLPTVELQSLKEASRSPTREVGSNVMVLGFVRTSTSNVAVVEPPGPTSVMVCCVWGYDWTVGVPVIPHSLVNVNPLGRSGAMVQEDFTPSKFGVGTVNEEPFVIV